MEINLPPEVEQMLHRQVASGRYASPTQALVQAIYLLDDLDDLDDLWPQADPEKLRQLVQEGWDSGLSSKTVKDAFPELRGETIASPGSPSD